MPASSVDSSAERQHASLPTRVLASLVVRLRWVVVVAWVAGAAAATIWLPGAGAGSNPGIRGILPDDAPALRAERASLHDFAFPLLSRTVVVRHRDRGLGPAPEAHAVRSAARAALRVARTGKGVAIGVPFSDRLLGRRPPTTVVDYLFFPPSVPVGIDVEHAQDYARHLRVPPGTQVAVTGLLPAELDHQQIISGRLHWIELATVAFLLVALGIHFRSVVAPLVALAAVAIAYGASLHLLGWGAHRLGSAIPRDVTPVIVVLVLGVVTDYCIFFLSRSRLRLGRGEPPADALRRVTAETAGIVTAAGLTAAAAMAALTLAHTRFFSAFGPTLAVSVLISVSVATTFVPALLAILGRRAFWPATLPCDEPGDVQEVRDDEGAPKLRGRVVRLAVRWPWVTVVVVLGLLGAAASGIPQLRLDVPEIRSLPAGAGPQRGYRLLTTSMPPGMVAPTVVVAEGSGIARRRAALARFTALLARQPGVARAFGPGDLPRRWRRRVALSRGGGAARFVAIFGHDPIGADGIATLRALRARAPALALRAGLHARRVLLAGDSAIASGVVRTTTDDLAIVVPVAAGAVLLVLALFLRALIAPLYLLLSTSMVVAATMGLAARTDTWFGADGLAFFVPYATIVMLIALSSDYTVFLIGRVWQEARRRRSLREAMVVAGSRASRPITTAGLILAGSFALLAIIPVSSYRMAAAMMGAGLLIDAFIIRTLLVPALVTIVGRRSMWPGRR